MNGYLLDTSIVLFVLSDDPRLKQTIRHAISTGPNIISVATYWEVTIKSMRGNLDIGEPRLWWQQTLDQLVARPMLIHPSHIAAIPSLPSIHGDPFDRMLIAQAIAEDLTLLTTDQKIKQYASSNLRVLA